MVTSLAIHPSGHFFAAGYDDGCIAFWAVDDDNKPLLVRTLHDLDVDILDPERLDALLIPEISRKNNTPTSGTYLQNSRGVAIQTPQIREEGKRP